MLHGLELSHEFSPSAHSLYLALGEKERDKSVNGVTENVLAEGFNHTRENEIYKMVHAVGYRNNIISKRSNRKSD